MATVQELTAQLESFLARAMPITLGTDAATNVRDLDAELHDLMKAVAAQPAEMLPVVEWVLARLLRELAAAPESAREDLASWRAEAAAARFDWVDPPRSTYAFLLVDSLENIREHCRRKIASA